MIRLPIVLNGEYTKIVGTVELNEELQEVYNTTNHLVINPIIKRQTDGSQAVVCFSVYPKPFEPTPTKKRRRKRGEAEGDLA